MADVDGSLDGIIVWDGVAERGARAVAWRDGVFSADEPSEIDRHEGLTFMPGLVDTHVHFDTPVPRAGRPQDRSWSLVTTPPEQAMHVAGNALRFARAGVTTARDLASTPVQLAVGRAFDQGVLDGPRLLGYGPVGMTAGHGDLFTPPGVRERPPVADGVDACRALVRTWAREGAAGIKIYTSGGILSLGDQVGWRNHTRAETDAIVDEAHALGLPVAAHTHSAEGLDLALDVGVDSIEHSTGIEERHFERLVSNRVPVSPTITVHDVILAGTDPDGEAARAKARRAMARRDPAFRAAAEAGVRFVLGTDANGHLVKVGGQWEELRRMCELFGWSAERALIAATSDAADSIGLGATVGRVRSGYAADGIVVRGRPWLDPAHLDADRVVAVIARGRVIEGALPTPSA